ncbi:MAG: hypothetical protein LUD68_07390 [Rikenellaceae bacterium]|nr:hypothetical protein [Rikenellaceae bacterium]
MVDPSHTLRLRLVREFRGVIDNMILSAHYADSPYSVQEMIEDLYRETWRNELQGRRLSP